MPEQLTMQLRPASPVVRSKLPLDERYRLWIADNPTILDEFAATARQLIDAGKRCSINRIFEECRERVHTVGDEYVLNNSFRAFAARDLIASRPAGHAGGPTEPEWKEPGWTRSTRRSSSTGTRSSSRYSMRCVPR